MFSWSTVLISSFNGITTLVLFFMSLTSRLKPHLGSIMIKERMCNIVVIAVERRRPDVLRWLVQLGLVDMFPFLQKSDKICTMSIKLENCQDTS